MNETLNAAKKLLNERYRLDSKGSGAISEYNRRCATKLIHVVAELESQLRLIEFYDKHIKAMSTKTELTYSQTEVIL